MAVDGFGSFVSNVGTATRRGLLELKRLIEQVRTSLADYLPLAGGSMTGNIVFPNQVDWKIVSEDGNSSIQFDSVSGNMALNTDGTLFFDTSASIGANKVATAQVGTYTPTLYNMAVGTGGSATNTAIYRWIGGPSVGDEGLLHIEGWIVFGTSGTTFPTNPAIGLPSGFRISASSPTIQRPMTTHFSLAAGGFLFGASQVLASANDRIAIVYANVVGSVLAVGNISPTAPAAWAAGDAMRWSATFPAVRV